MYKAGHTGAALLTFSPLGFALVAFGEGELALLCGLSMAVMAMVPDVDRALPFIEHRGITHTIPFALAFGVVVGAVGVVVGTSIGRIPYTALGTLGFVVGTLSVITHIAADSITPMGVKPYWPISRRHHTFGIVPANDPFANYLLLLLGVSSTVVLGLLAATS